MRQCDDGPNDAVPAVRLGRESGSESGQSDSSGRSVDLREVLAHHPDLSESELIECLCTDQVKSWRAGKRIPAETYLSLHPVLLGAEDVAFELIYGEFLLRESLGEPAAPEEFLWRFPQFAHRLRRQIGLHYALVREVDSSEFDRPQPPNGADPGDEAPEQVAAGPSLPGYRILGALGRGGMGVVYRARQLSLNRLVALKVIQGGTGWNNDAVDRFRAEAEAVARLQHPNIIQVYEMGEFEGLHWMALELAAGGSLEAKLAGTPQEPQAAAGLVEILARAIHEAHQHGIVHRDLKPANVVLTEHGAPKITDFGLAKLLQQEGSATLTGVIVGTPSYMAPEQLLGAPGGITAAVDVYALGAILYELLTGRPPFKGATPLSTLEQVAGQDPLPPGQFQRHTPRDLETICMKCLAKEPHRRYPSAWALAEDLRCFAEGRPILARPVSAWEQAWKWARRRPSVATAIGSLVTAVMLLLTGALYYNTRLQAALETTRAAQEVAVASSRSALTQRNLALGALDQLVFEVQEKLGETSATRSARRSLLDTAIAGLEQIARSTEESTPDLSRAVAHQKLGEIYRQIGRAADSRRQFELARQLAEQLPGVGPTQTAVLECLTEAYLGIGEIDLRAEQPRDAEQSFRRALELAATIAAAVPATAASRRGLIEAYHHLGRAQEATGERTEAELNFQSMQDLARDWVVAEPASIPARDLLASSHFRLGRMNRMAGKPSAARDEYLKAIALSRTLHAAEPDRAELTSHLAMAVLDLATLDSRRHDFTEARTLFQESVQLWKGLVDADPEDREFQVWLVHAEYNFGMLERLDDHLSKALELYLGARDRLIRLDREGKLEGRPAFKYRHMMVLNREIAYCEAAPAVLDNPSVARSQPPFVRILLLSYRAKLLAKQGRDTEVAATASELCTVHVEDWEDRYYLALALAACITELNPPPSPLPRPSPWAELQHRCTDKAVAELTAAVEHGYRGVSILESEYSFESIRHDPGYQQLIKGLLHPSAPAIEQRQ